ncbi:peptidoglycan endopeptidase [Streptomyces dangxiongensis]|uniref:Peptidoglycan endopeptidase n=2 Tax=Streptomyces dangxiongensis TaxID=1442032 RepID=A0A3G2JQP6_9ACTN|nr:peptidoglycan endopeptidase [Streptomyces dangxiongensis]
MGELMGGPVAAGAVTGGAVGWPAAMPAVGRAAPPDTALPQPVTGYPELITVESTGRSTPEPATTGGSLSLPGFAEQASAGVGAAETALLPAVAPPTAQANRVQTPRTLPGAAPGRPSPTVTKGDSLRKLTSARELLTRYTSPLASAAGTVQPAPARTTWNTGTQPGPGTTPTAAPRVPVMPEAPSTAFGHLGSLVPPTPASTLAPAPLPGTDSRVLRAAKAIAFARAQVGRPCVWGATGPGSYDCSSLVQAAWRAAGVTLPRAAHQQALAGTPVTLAVAEPGDLVLFFDDDRHVGLYVGDGMMVHAPGPGSTIREESVYGAGEAAIHRVVRPA